MKMKKPSYVEQLCSILSELKSQHPSYTIGMHFSTAFADYGDVWNCSDKEIIFALEKYAAQLEMDIIPENIDYIIEDGKHMFDENTEEEDEEY
jgi:hypothetical protein